MAVSQKDGNFVSTATGVLNTDGKTIEVILADPSTHALKASDGTTGSDNGPKNALKDDNHISTLIATSSVDGKTPVVLYVDASGNLLIDSI